MASSTGMKSEILSRLKFDSKVKEGATLGDRYTDTKSFEQFMGELEKVLEERVEVRQKAYEKALDKFKLYKNWIVIENPNTEGQVWAKIRLGEPDETQEALNAMYNAITAAAGIDQLAEARKDIKKIEKILENDGTKAGIDNIRQTIQQNDMLLALLLSSPDSEHEAHA